MNTPIRQGDVLLIPVVDIPPNLVEVERDRANRLVLALGETSGHAHAIMDEPAALFSEDLMNEMADRFLRVEREVSLDHVDTLRPELSGDHDSVVLPVGNYIVRHKREYQQANHRHQTFRYVTD